MCEKPIYIKDNVGVIYIWNTIHNFFMDNDAKPRTVETMFARYFFTP
jgi:hypothetical protein